MGILDELRNKNPKKFAIKPQFSLGATFLAVVIGKVVQYTLLATIGYLCWNYVVPALGGVSLTFWQILALLILAEIFIYRISGTGSNAGY